MSFFKFGNNIILMIVSKFDLILKLFDNTPPPTKFECGNEIFKRLGKMINEPNHLTELAVFFCFVLFLVNSPHFFLVCAGTD